MPNTDLLEAVQPGYQGMLPGDPDDQNPNQQPDHLLNKKLGKGLGYNPVQVALDRRHLRNEIEKAVEQLTTEALTEGIVLSRPEAIAKVRQIWASQARETASSTPSPQPSTLTSNQPLSPQAKQDFLNKIQQTVTIRTAQSGGTIPQPQTPEPDSLPPIPDTFEELEADRHTVAAIKRALLPEECENGIFAEEIEATVAQEAEPTYPEGCPTIPIADTDTGDTPDRDLTDDEHFAAANDPPVTSAEDVVVCDKSYDPDVDDIFKDMEQPLESLEEEIEKDALASLHPSTQQLLKALPKRHCIQFFRQSLSMAGLPTWSRWSNAMRADLQEAYIELVSDPFEVDQVVRRLQGFTVSYGKTRLLRMVATLMGIDAWMSLETPHGS